MSLADNIEDEASLFLNADDFAYTATYKALGAGSGTSVLVVVNEADTAILELRESHATSREASFSVPAATVTSPARTDTYTIATGPCAGTWVCTTVENRDAGIATVRCRLETTTNTVAEGAKEIRV
jgi:hypothetical protein